MTIKDILVHIDTSPSCGGRLELAAALARRFDAYLVGAFILPSTELLELADSAAAVKLALNLAELEEKTTKLEEKFRRLLKREDLTGEWYTARGRAETCVAQRALAADLVVLGQRDPNSVLPLAYDDRQVFLFFYNELPQNPAAIFNAVLPYCLSKGDGAWPYGLKSMAKRAAR